MEIISNLVKLEGTEKQIAWANDLRNKLIEKLINLNEKSFVAYNITKNNKEIILKNLLQITDAKFYIDNRIKNFNDILIDILLNELENNQNNSITNNAITKIIKDNEKINNRINKLINKERTLENETFKNMTIQLIYEKIIEIDFDFLSNFNKENFAIYIFFKNKILNYLKNL